MPIIRIPVFHELPYTLVNPTAASGLTTFNIDFGPNVEGVYLIPSTLNNEVFMTDANAIKLDVTKSWIGKTLAEVFPTGINYTYLYARSVGLQSWVTLYHV